MALRHELSEHDSHRQRLEQRIRGVESDLFELSKNRVKEAARVDNALKSLIATVAELERDKEALRKIRQRRREERERQKQQAG